MAGTLTISTLSDGTNSTSATNCIQGSAKAWVNFNGVTTATIRASYNVSSVTRNQTGVYTINFTNAMPDANYAVNALANGVYNGSAVQLTDTSGTDNNSPNITTSAVSICVRGNGNSSTSLLDAGVVCASIFR